ncbi:glucosaminidase domain-containing protein [Amphritea japonica]|nr:glucosaminidase domain-containing protein [Amphritea japonica]
MFGFGALIQIADQRKSSATAVIYKSLHSPADIIPLSNPVIPVAYTSVISLKALPVNEKKERFIALLLPAILISKAKLKEQKNQLNQMLAKSQLSATDQAWLNQKLSAYRVDSTTKLSQRMIELPNSLILAQAAIETGWGSSRFFIQALNIFGVWSFDPTEKRIMARQQREGKPVYLKRYDSLLGAIDDYQLTLGKGSAYRALRAATQQTQNSLQLLQHLGRYSELGDIYIQRLNTVIRQNNLRQYDDYQL